MPMARNLVDQTDIRILEKLVENVRKGSGQMGDELKLRRQVVDYRIKKMESNGTIIGYRMLVNLTKLGFEYRRVHVKLCSLSRKEKEDVLQFLVQHPKTVWVTDCDGKYDLIVGFIASGPYEFERVLSDFLVRFHSVILYYDIVHILELGTPTRDFSGTRHTRPIQGFMTGDFPAERLSDFDKRIVNELARNGRQTALEMAKKIRAEPANVNYHLKQILKKGLVFSNIQFGYDVFGFELYKTLLYLKKPARKRIEELKRFSRSYTRIWDYVETLGKWQFELDIESKGHEDYYEIMDSVQDNFSDIVSSYDTIFIRKERKFSFDVFNEI